jgi:putative oxidoreductase
MLGRFAVSASVGGRQENRMLNSLDRYAPYMLSVLRIVAALLFIEHGTMKLFGFPPSGEAARGGLGTLILFAALIETIGGLLLLVGLFTRPAAFIMSGEMAVAYFMAHAPHGFFPAVNRGDAAILFCFIFLYVFFAGPGAWSIDGARESSRSEAPNLA